MRASLSKDDLVFTEGNSSYPVLRYKPTSETDMNNLKDMGIFIANFSSNAPTGVGWCYAIVLIDTENYVRQIVMPINTNTIYSRNFDGYASGTQWTSWQQVTLT